MGEGWGEGEAAKGVEILLFMRLSYLEKYFIEGGGVNDYRSSP
jgi:hypothetical protein